MNSITLRGEAADLRWGYHRAADLGAWSVENGHLSASVRSIDAFRLTQQPLSFVVMRPNGVRWEWRLRDVQVMGDTIHAQLEE